MVVRREGSNGWHRFDSRVSVHIGPACSRWMLCLLLALVVYVFLVQCPIALAVTVGEEWASNVSSGSATLQAQVNPEGTATEFKFEYGRSVVYEMSAPVPEGNAGAGGSATVVSAHVQGLLPDTIYHFRVVATRLSPKETVDGTDEALTTQSANGELTLPDGRVWELVSPATKDGALIPPLQEHGELVQAAENGGAISYTAIGPVEADPAGNANETQILSVRDADGGWASQDIATPHEVATGVAFDTGQEYKFFSPELSVGLVEPFGSGAPPLSPGASEQTVYLRADAPLSPEGSEQGIHSEAVMEGGYKSLVTSKPGYANVQPGVEFGGQVKFAGATADLNHIVLHSNVPLTAETPEGHRTEEGGLYEWEGGLLQLVSILPENGEQERNAFLGGREGYNARDAISSTGSRIVWSAKKELFMRNLPNEQTVELDANQGGEGGRPTAQFQLANSDGSQVFFTDEAKLTAESTANPGEPDLYECEMVEDSVGAVSCKLSDLTLDTGGSADVQGVVLAGSNSGSYIYFVAEGRLTGEEKNGQGEEAQVGMDNLYVLHYSDEQQRWEAPVFVAALSEEDSPDWGGQTLPGNLGKVTSRVSPNGHYVAFMSERSLTKYDNLDVNSGVPDEEVFLYDALSKRLVCVSCNPTGERPAGVLDSVEANGGEGLLVDQQEIWSGDRWLAGSIPGWTAMEEATARYQARYLSDDGRVFFDSSDALVPQAANGLMDAYQYEPVGIGSCESSSGIFSESSDGCVGLISSGSSGDESVFMDASESGEDVFFLTAAPLVSADKDTAFDVYDAHVCSELAPCAVQALSPPPCVTEASCKAAPSLQPSIFGASGSATFTGTGNLASSSSGTTTPKKITKCSKHKKLSHGKCVARKTKKKAKAKKAVRDRRAG